MEDVLFSSPEITWRTAHLSLKEQVDLRRFLRAQQHFLANSNKVLSSLLTSTIAAIHQVVTNMPNVDGTSLFTIPLVDAIPNAAIVIDRTINTFIQDEGRDAGLYTALRDRFYRNICAVSKVPPYEDSKKPLIMPSQSGLYGSDLVDAYLAGTPFAEIFQTAVPFQLKNRFAHHHILARTGSGKTNLLGCMIGKDLDEVVVGRASIIVLDSQGTLVPSIARLPDFAPGGRLHGRLVYIDPTDVEHPLALNIFGRSGNRATTLLEKRTEHADLLDLLLFLFSALRQEATGRQETLLRPVASLILEIPDATLSTLNAIFDPKKGSINKFDEYIARLDPMTQTFFQTDFATGEFSQTRGGIRARLQGLTTDPIFASMFSATTQKLDFAAEMDAGKVILINADENLLKTQTEVFGRFFIALAKNAAQARSRMPEAKRMPTYFYIDECYKYIKDDTNVEKVFDTGRQFKLGIVISHQRLDQLAPALQSAASQAEIKMVHGPVDRDENTMARQLRATSEWIASLPKHTFATYLNGMSRAAALKIPLSPLATAPRMTEAQWQQVRAEMRRKYAQSPSVTDHIAGPDIMVRQESHDGRRERQQETNLHLDDANGRIDKALRLLTPYLRATIERELPRFHSGDWQHRLSIAQGADRSQPLDAYAALKTILDNWQSCFKHTMKIKTRTDVSKALEARNAISHATSEIPAPDAISYLTAIRDIASALSAAPVVDTLKVFIDDQIKAAVDVPQSNPRRGSDKAPPGVTSKKDW